MYEFGTPSIVCDAGLKKLRELGGIGEDPEADDNFVARKPGARNGKRNKRSRNAAGVTKVRRNELLAKSHTCEFCGAVWPAGSLTRQR